MTPDEKDRATLRTNIILSVLGLIVLVADVTFLALNPGLKAAYLGPIAGLLLLRLTIAYTTIKQTRARLRNRASHTQV